MGAKKKPAAKSRKPAATEAPALELVRPVEIVDINLEQDDAAVAREVLALVQGWVAGVVEFLQEAEALGYHSLWVFQRLLYAIEPKNEYPPVPGKTWPKPFERVFDPIVTLAYVAAANLLLDPPRRALQWPRAPVLAALTAAACYYVFEGYLQVLLPRGSWTGF